MSLKNDTAAPSKIRELAYELRIKDAMTTDIVTVAPGDTMEVVRDILQNKRISGLPVLDGPKMIGLISIDNYINCIAGREAGHNETVDRHMTKQVITLYSDEPLVHAVSQFDKHGYGRFPVLERKDRTLVGILTKGDVVKCLLKKLEVQFNEEEIQKYRASHIFKDIGSDGTTLILKYKIQGGNFNAAGERSGFLKTNLLRLGIHPAVSRRIVVASCEAEMNIVIFTPGGELTAHIEEDRIVINAIDNGPGIPDIEKAMRPGFSTAPDWVREMGFGAGMGLPNIKKCSDEMRIDSALGQGTNLEFTVFMEK